MGLVSDLLFPYHRRHFLDPQPRLLDFLFTKKIYIYVYRY